MCCMNRKQLKKDARKNLKRNFFRTILVIFIAGIIINGGYNFTTFIFKQPKDIYIQQLEKKTNYTTLKKYARIALLGEGEIRGFVAPLINNVYKNNSLVVGLVDTVDNMVFGENTTKQIVSISAFIVSLLLFIFVQNAFRVNRARYVLEQRRYNTKADKIFYSYQIGKTFHISIVLLLNGLYLLLFVPTIVGGVIVFYRYRLMMYIIAENPNITTREAFRLSKELTDGYKFELFKLDVSLIGWYILQILTLGLSSILYFDAYRECIFAEAYMYIRNEKIDKIQNRHLLTDDALAVDTYQNKLYPKENYQGERKKIFNVDFRNPYSITDYILVFFTLVIFGWLWEVLLGFIETGTFINRGTMHGPWIPLYGYGGMLTLIGLKKLRNHPLLFFACSALICGFIEYFTAVWLETYKGLSWWTYQGYFLNLNGRICFEGLLVFGLGCTAVTYLFAPILNNIYSKLPKKLAIIICTILLFLYGVDFAYTQFYPNTGYGVSETSIN